MAKMILGYEVARPEQQRKTALAILGFIAAIAIGGGVAAFMIAGFEQSGREQVLATVVSFDKKCRYVVRNVSKRVSYYDHTGYIDCAQAQTVADRNDNPLGSVQRRRTAVVDFRTEDNRKVRTSVAFHGDDPIRIGGQVEILYLVKNPRDAIEFDEIPLFGKRSIAHSDRTTSNQIRLDQTSFDIRSTIPDTAETGTDPVSKPAPPQPKPSESVSDSTKLWIGIGALLFIFVIVFLALRWSLRLIKRLLSGSNSTSSVASTADTVSAAKLSATLRTQPQQTFGHR